MDDKRRGDLMKMGWEIHSEIEESYRQHPAVKGDGHARGDWLEKQRLLLADMAIHLLQTAIKPGNVELHSLQNNLHAILTISDQFLPHAKLKKATERIYAATV